MNKDELAEKTPTYRERITSRPLSWLAVAPKRICRVGGRLQIVEGEQAGGSAVEGYAFGYMDAGKVLSQDGLPTEFFNHQLAECDAGDERALFDFVAEWGFPYSIMRHGEMLLDRASLRGDFDTTGECLAARHKENEERARRSRDAIGETGRMWDFFERNGDAYGLAAPLVVISRAEAEESIRLLQWAVKTVIDFEAGRALPGSPAPQYALIGGATCSRTELGTEREFATWREPAAGRRRDARMQHFNDRFWDAFGGSYAPWSRLVAFNPLSRAICNQFADVIAAEDVPWRQCTCEGCGRVFKYKQERNGEAGSPYPNALYCSSKCYDRQNKRNKRAAAKNRIQH